MVLALGSLECGEMDLHKIVSLVTTGTLGAEMCHLQRDKETEGERVCVCLCVKEENWSPGVTTIFGS